ncbi:hypothetical protein QYF36_001998 [Acer negundo]|nr:hypothetical protein QYF36_001998 [Acer negundo]
MFLLYLWTIFALMISSSTCQSNNYHFFSSPPNDTAATKNYISKLDSVLNSLPTKASVNSFYNESSEGVYILFLCRGDVSAATCQTCVKNATQVIRQQCSSNRTAIIWYNECMLHYSNTNFFGLLRSSPDFLMWNTDNITVPDEPNYGALGLVYSLIDYASNTYMKLGTNDRIVVSNGSRHGYALVHFQWKIGWEASNFTITSYNLTAGKGGNNKTKIVIISVSSFAAIAAALLGFYCYSSSLQKKRQKELEGGIFATDEDHSEELHFFSLTAIMAATNNFSDENKLGESGFGPVYKDDPANRPTMSQVLMLGSQTIDLPSPSTAPYSVSRFTTMSDESSTFGTGTGILTSDQTKSTSTSNY